MSHPVLPIASMVSVVRARIANAAEPPHHSRMHRQPVRFICALLALWSLVASGSPVPLHDCASHHAASAHVSHGQHAAHGSASAHGEAHSDHAPSSPNRDCCRCLTCGCAVAAIGLPTLALAIPVASDLTVQVVALPVLRAPHIARARFTLPFGNGPPLA